MLNNFNIIFKNPSIFRGVFCLGIILFFTDCFAQPNLKFTDIKKNFGFVKKGELVTIEFNFKNSGNEPAIITDALVECSCTSVNYPKQPIAPNQTAKITVTFDTKSVYDRQDRSIEIILNSKNKHQKLRFKGVVLK